MVRELGVEHEGLQRLRLGRWWCRLFGSTLTEAFEHLAEFGPDGCLAGPSEARSAVGRGHPAVLGRRRRAHGAHVVGTVRRDSEQVVSLRVSIATFT